MLPLAHIKIFTTFALRYLFNLGVNHKIYTLTNAYSVVFPISYYTVISKCRNFGRATLSLFSTKIKFFTFYATLSKKFSSREQQYLDANGNSTTRSTCNHFSVFRLFFPGVPGLLRCYEPQSYPHHYRQTRHRNAYPVFLRQEKSLLRAWQQLRKSLPRAYHQYAYAYGSSINLKIHTKL